MFGGSTTGAIAALGGAGAGPNLDFRAGLGFGAGVGELHAVATDDTTKRSPSQRSDIAFLHERPAQSLLQGLPQIALIIRDLLAVRRTSQGHVPGFLPRRLTVGMPRSTARPRAVTPKKSRHSPEASPSA